MSGTSPKVHFIEDFTATECPFCGNAKPALSRISDEFRDSMVVLYWHMWSSDPYYAASVGPARGSWYSSSFGIPTIIIDGGGDRSDGNLISVGSGSPSGSYGTYRNMLQNFADTSSNMALSIEGDLKPQDVTVRVTITVTDPVTQTNLYLRTALYEDMLFYPQSDPQGDAPYTQRNIVRAVNYQPITLTQGDVKTYWVNFTINPTWMSNLNKLGVAAWVQSDTRRPVTVSTYTFNIADVLNAAKLDLVPKGMMLYKDTGTAADYLEYYAEVLAEAGEHFDMWNAVMPGDTATLDDRSLPSTSVLADTPLLLWNLDSTFPALSATERSLISDYLNASGNLLIDASNLGFEGWTTYRSWFQGYLHANFTGDDSGVPVVRGAIGDPIGDAYQASDLDILSSPDRVTPIPPAAAPFLYPVGTPGWPASVRATHDSDSRIVYLGFQYLDNDAAFMRNNVMTSIVDWIDGSAPPRVDVLIPDGGETLDLGTPYDITWKANDVRVPVDGVDIYFTDNYGPSPTWQLLASGQPNDGRYAWSGPSVDSATCRVRVVVRDSSPATADGEAISQSNFICGAPPLDTLTITPVGTAPADAPQGYVDIAMARLDASVNTNSVTLETVKLDLSGTGTDSDIAAVGLWMDNGDSVFDSATDILMDSDVFVASTMTLQVMQTIVAGSDEQFFVTFAISPTATIDDYVGLRIQDSAYFTVTAPAVVACSACPLDTFIPGGQTRIVVPPFFEINFASAGWYLVSFPVVVGSTTLTSVLSSLTGSYAMVRWFDASDFADRWKAYDANRMQGDLRNLNNRMGFWILIVTPDTLHVDGAMPSAMTSILLQPGWNLVGFPSASATYTVGDLKTATGATRVEGFDGGAGPYYLQVLSDSYTMTAGEGYWVYLPGSATVWNVPPT